MSPLNEDQDQVMSLVFHAQDNVCASPHLMPMSWSLQLLDRRRETVDTELSVCSASINSSCWHLIAAVGDNGHGK